MNRIILTISLFFALIWAVQPVSRTEKTDKEPVIKIQIQEDKGNQEDTKVIQIKNKEPGDSKNDHFIDTDSNNVNDQREDDLLKIKQLKTKFKELFKKETEPQPSKKPSKRPK
uniref:Uncharacterized protein n=1 Tax=candidate division WOR-3 bacterium TaxID=2052148 RepID=A0A7V1EJ44_UNCW3